MPTVRVYKNKRTGKMRLTEKSKRFLALRSGYQKLKRKYGGRKGFMHVVRKTQDITYISSGAENADYTQYPAAGANTMLKLGTPVQTQLAQLTGDQIYDVPFQLTFQLNQVAGYTEFTTLFDQYKINSVKLRWNLGNNVSQIIQPGITGGAGVIPLPYIEYEQDYDSTGVPDPTQFRQNMAVKTKYFNAMRNTIYMGVKPKPNLTVGLSTDVSPTGPVSAVVPRRSPWLNSAFDGIAHLGIRGVIRNMSLTGGAIGSVPITIDTSFSLSFKDVI